MTLDFQLVIVGEEGVGKSALIVQFNHNQFIDNYEMNQLLKMFTENKL